MRHWIGNWLQNHPVPASPFSINSLRLAEPSIQSHWKVAKKEEGAFQEYQCISWKTNSQWLPGDETVLLGGRSQC